MKIVAPVTDYVPKSVLMTKGDLIVRGDAQPERLAAGADGCYLMSNGAGELPTWQDPFAFLTTKGDILVRGDSGVERLAYGSQFSFLGCYAPGGTPSWEDPFDFMTAVGDIIYRAGGGRERLAIGSEGQFLGVDDEFHFPEWQDPFAMLTADGDLITRVSGSLGKIAAGASEYYLKSQGAGNNLTWDDPLGVITSNYEILTMISGVIVGMDFWTFFEICLAAQIGWGEYNDVMICDGTDVNIINLNTFVQVTLSANQVVEEGNEDIVEFDTEVNDDYAEFDTTNHVFEPYSDGIYHIDLQLWVSIGAIPTTINVKVTKNGVTLLLSTRVQAPSIGQHMLQINGLVELTSSDSLEVYLGATSNDVTIFDDAMSSWLHIYRIPHVSW